MTMEDRVGKELVEPSEETVELSRELVNNLIRNYTSSVTDMVMTNLGSWEGKIVTEDEVWDRFVESPLGAAFACAWAISVMPSGWEMDEDEERREFSYAFMKDLASAFSNELVKALVTAHNEEVTTINEAAVN